MGILPTRLGSRTPALTLAVVLLDGGASFDFVALHLAVLRRSSRGFRLDRDLAWMDGGQPR